MRRLRTFATRLWRDESGAALIEYSILIGLITAAVITAVLAVGTDIQARWDKVLDSLGKGKQT